MLRRNDQQLAATRRLLTNADFQAFTGWISGCLNALYAEIVTCEQDIKLRHLQGQAQALVEILRAVEETRTIMERRER